MRIAILAALLLTGPLHAATSVTVKPLGELWFELEQSAPASAMPLNAPVISAELTARVTGIHADVGAVVSEGDLLAELDCRRADADLEAARAGLRQFEAQYTFALHQVERADDLLKKRSISDQEVEQRKSEEQRLSAQIDAQKAAIVQAGIQASNCRVTAPFDAVVTERMADRGMLAVPGTPLLKLLQADSLEVGASLNPDEARGVESEGTRLWFVGNGERYALELRTIVPLIDEATRTREARFRFSNASPVAGTAGRLVWQQGEKLIPAEFLVRRDGRLGVFTARDGKAVFHALDGALEGRPARVGLPAETLIVVQGRESLADGDELLDAKVKQASDGEETAAADDAE